MAVVSELHRGHEYRSGVVSRPCFCHDAVWQQGAKYGHRGATLLEFSVVVTVLAVLAITLIGRVLTAEEYAEKSAMELTIAHMRAGLRAQVGALLIADRVSEIGALAGGNPVDWLKVPPENYIGEYDGKPAGDTEGAWYFDAKQRELVYTTNANSHFVPSAEEGYSVRLKIVPIETTTTTVVQREPVWVAIAVVNNYRWF